MSYNLSVRSDFSIGESMLQIDKLIEAVKKAGYTGVALTDTMSIHGLVDFSNKAKAAEIKPIIGCRIRVVDDPTYRKPTKASGLAEKPNPSFMVKVYAINDDGIRSIMDVLSKSMTDDYFYYVARVGLNEILTMKGVIVTTGDMQGVFSHDDYSTITTQLVSAHGKDNVFIELMPADTPLFDRLNARAIQTAKNLCMEDKTLVTYPALYESPDDYDSLEVLQAITSNTQMDSSWRPQQYLHDMAIEPRANLVDRANLAHQRQLKWHDGDAADYDMWKVGIQANEVIGDRCEYEYHKQDVTLPKMADNEFQTLGLKCIEGWKRRFGREVLGYKPGPADLPIYQERLRYELAVLKQMGFAGYFLMTEDLVMWSKNNGIIVGPGRGSVGGSLIAYLIGITEIDPIRFNLLFERFINPDRQDLPDADLDFMSSRRHEVVGYLQKRYGVDRVAGISNYSKLGAASSMRDTGRIFGLSGMDLSMTKLVPSEHGQSATLEEAAASVPEINNFKINRPEMWKHATKLEGAMRSFGQHAAGVVVAGQPIVNRAVFQTRGGTPIVNWDKRVVEDMGLVKMDLLGLSTLDTLAVAADLIKENHGVTVDYTAIPLEDPDVMDAFGRGDTTGVFQFESPGMRRLLRDLATTKRLTFEDVAAATALYRPGPMDSGMMDDFVAIKKGANTAHYDHPNMEEALKNTEGVIIYQEQVMRVAVDLAGFTFTEADHLRKAMGKKDKDKMAKMKDQFVDGAYKHSGMEKMQGAELFDKIAAFAGYGFNKSHAVEYSVISVWTMWLRVKYPTEYFAACMSIVGEDKLPGLVKDARKYGIEVLPPDVNYSADLFKIKGANIVAPFNAVKNISGNTALNIVKLREAQPGKRFNTAADFKAAAAQKGSKVNVRVVGNLELVGALAEIEPGAKPPRDIDRRKDQIELMGGLIIDAVKADRQTDAGDPFLRTKIIDVIRDYRRCDACELKCKNHPSIRMKNTVKFMVVSDCPNWEEEKKENLLEGKVGALIKNAIKEAGLSVAHGYYTTLVKAVKEGKFLEPTQIAACSQFLNREIEIIKPPIIVALGSSTIKYFIPGHKGGVAGLAGTSVFNKDVDANIVCGLNPAQILFNEDKMEELVNTFKAVAEILE